MAKTIKLWIDPKGIQIPPNRIRPIEKLKEKHAEALLKMAQDVNNRLQKLRQEFEESCEEIFVQAMEDQGVDVKTRKGNFTFYNFDESIKIEKSINERIDFDQLLIEAAKAKFDEFLKGSTNGVDEMIQAMILDAFATRKGKLDVKRIMGLVAYKHRVSKEQYPLFHEAVELIEQSIRRPESKAYYRIGIKLSEGNYQNIELNFSNV